MNPLLSIENAAPCRIIERINRFVVKVEMEDRSHLAHITNTGRLEEFLTEGKQGFCFKTRPGRSTDCRLFAVEDRGLGALIDTWLQMKAFEKLMAAKALPWLEDCRIRKRNPRLGDSLLDYFLYCEGRPVYLEIKSAVLREGGYAMYPDCPTTRGQRHVRELSAYAAKGGTAFIVFMAALPGVKAFRPHTEADPELHRLLAHARDRGVAVKAVGIFFDPRDGGVHLFDPDLKVEI